MDEHMATNYMAAAALGTDDQSKALSARSVADSSRPSTPGWGYAQPKTSVNVIPAIGNVRAPPKVGINEANKESMYHQSCLLLAVRQGDVAEVAFERRLLGTELSGTDGGVDSPHDLVARPAARRRAGRSRQRTRRAQRHSVAGLCGSLCRGARTAQAPRSSQRRG